MAALAVILMVPSPPLAWAKDTRRKYTPWVVSIYHVGVATGISFVSVSRHCSLEN